MPQTPVGVWRHIALVAADGSAQVYVDGQPVGTAASNFSKINPAAAIHIGNGYQSGRWFKGQIGEVAVYGHALSPGRIQARIDGVWRGLLHGKTKLKSWKGDCLHRPDSAGGGHHLGHGDRQRVDRESHKRRQN